MRSRPAAGRSRFRRFGPPLLAVAVCIGMATASFVVTTSTRDEAERVEGRRRSVAAETARHRDAVTRRNERVDDVQRAAAREQEAIDRDRHDTQVVSNGAAELRRLRGEIEVASERLAAVTVANQVEQADLDRLVACRDTLRSAAGALVDRNAPGGAHGREIRAAGILRLGRSGCQDALEHTRGDTGAVHPYDFADPSVTDVGGSYLAFGTHGPAGAIQALTSADLRTWEVADPVLPSLPAWAEPGFTWAPSATKVGDLWVLYYTARVRGSRQQCISAAVSRSPQGPYLDDSWLPMVCPLLSGGAIDPEPYRDELGTLRLLWKSEGETVGDVARIWTQTVGLDGRSLVGEPTELLAAGRGWEDGIVENPSMARMNGQWVLLYSGSRWDTSRYALAHAVCLGPTGPCVRPGDDVLLASSGQVAGPGGGTFFRTSSGGAMVAYHAWDRGHVGTPDTRRLHVAPVSAGPDGHLRVG